MNYPVFWVWVAVAIMGLVVLFLSHRVEKRTGAQDLRPPPRHKFPMPPIVTIELPAAHLKVVADRQARARALRAKLLDTASDFATVDAIRAAAGKHPSSKNLIQLLLDAANMFDELEKPYGETHH